MSFATSFRILHYLVAVSDCPLLHHLVIKQLVTAFTEEAFRSINGYSNRYWGWGGEDDDLYHRMRKVFWLAKIKYASDWSKTLKVKNMN